MTNFSPNGFDITNKQTDFHTLSLYWAVHSD